MLLTCAKKLRNIHIVRSIIIMWLISLAATITMGVVGYSSLSKLYAATNTINVAILPKLKDWGDVNGHMGVLRNTLTKIIDRPFDNQNEKSMYELNQKIREIMDRNEALVQSNPEEAEQVRLAKEAYVNYYSYIPDIIEQRRKGLVPDPQVTNVNMGKYGTDLAQKIVNLVEYQKTSAQTETEASKNLYHRSMLLFGTIFAVSVLILTLISVIVILVIRSFIRDFMEQLKILSTGDFTVRFHTELTNEFGVMSQAISRTVHSISGILGMIRHNSTDVTSQSYKLSAVSGQMHASIREVSTAIQDVSQGSANQAEELVSMHESLDMFNKALDRIADSVTEVGHVSHGINDKAQASNSQLTEFVASVHGMTDSFGNINSKLQQLMIYVNQIMDFTGLIQNISKQTNLLALNASIEASRAGEAGKGFAVVASEIRKLAEDSKRSSEGIHELLQNVRQHMDEVSSTTAATSQDLNRQGNTVNHAVDTFREIINAIQVIMPQIDGVSQSVSAINREKARVLHAAENASGVAEENSASAEEISASSIELASSSNEVAVAAEELQKLTQEMMQEIERFKL